MTLPELPQGWTLVTAATQQEVDERLLRQTAGNVALHLCGLREPVNVFNRCRCGADHEPGWQCCGGCDAHNDWHQVGWLVVEGGSDPVHPQWVRDLRDQCQAAGVPFCFLGWGELVPINQNSCDIVLGKDERVLVPQMDRPYYFPFYRVGSFRSGRLLDGKVWDERPEGVKS